MQINRQKYPIEFYQECAKFIAEGHTLAETAQKFEINYTTLRSNLVKLGLRVPNRVGVNNKTVSFDEHYFDVIDTHNKAYFLGLLMSDGYSCKTPYSYAFGLALQLQDMYIIEKLKQELQSQAKISIYKNSAKLTLSGSQYVYNVLMSYGICENKSHSDYSIPAIPDEFFNSFVRGYFDGDGCITIKATGYSVTSICCNSEVFLSSLQKKLETTFNITGTHLRKEQGSRKNPLFILYISTKENQRAFKDFIYQNDEIKLIRKYKKFMEIPW